MEDTKLRVVTPLRDPASHNEFAFGGHDLIPSINSFDQGAPKFESKNVLTLTVAFEHQPP
jgi:hypothetical protein